MTSGVFVRDVFIYAECGDEDCGWHGCTDAVIDPEDRINGMNAQWRCPCCGRHNETDEKDWT